MLDISRRTAFDEQHNMFRESVRKFFETEAAPHLDRWEHEGLVEPEFWLKAGEAGLLCPTVPEEYGGLGLDFRFNAVVAEEMAYAMVPAGFTLQSDIIVDYILNYGTEEQKQKYLPRMVTGELITAIAMTEPGAGSDLQGVRTTAIKDGDEYVINGSKTYITNGQTADLIIVVAKTNPAEGAKGISLIFVESDAAGFSRGRNLDKIGLHGGDTSELFFSDVRVKADALLGQEGHGFYYLMGQLAQERLSIAISAQAAAQKALDLAVTYAKERVAFGKPIITMQTMRHNLAEMAAKVQVGWAHLDWCLQRHVAHELTPVEASAAKLFHTDLQWEMVDRGLQVHGGAGYMNEFPIARLWRDSRVTRIFGGTNEVMKEVIGRGL